MWTSPLVGGALVVALNLWVAWRYRTAPLGQDQGIWMLWGFTGALPYRDHVDCKPPGIHLWFWLLACVTGRRLALTKFLHHTTIGGFALAATVLTGHVEAGLLFTALAQSAWLHAYHASSESLSAGFLLLALLLEPWPAALCAALAVLCNLKLGPSCLVLLVLRDAWAQLAVLCFAGGLSLGLWHLFWPRGLRDVWYGAVIVAHRITRWRRQMGQGFIPSWTGSFSIPLLLVVPAVVGALWADPDPILWSVVLTYVAVNTAGRAWRPYHWIPLAIVAVTAPAAAVPVLLAEWISNRLYLGNVVTVSRAQLARRLEEVKVVGERLRAMRGSLWVSDEHTQIYIYARKRPATGLVEQVEIRHVVPERRKSGPPGSPPDLVVLGPDSIPAAPRAYSTVFRHGPFTVLARGADPTRHKAGTPS